jgi:hypothetical protein
MKFRFRFEKIERHVVILDKAGKGWQGQAAWLITDILKLNL